MADKSKMTSGDRFLIAMLLSAVITLVVGFPSYLTGYKMPTWLLFVIGIVVLALLFYAGYQFIGVIYDACTLLYSKVFRKPIASTAQEENETPTIELPVIEQKVAEIPKIEEASVDAPDTKSKDTPEQKPEAAIEQKADDRDKPINVTIEEPTAEPVSNQEKEPSDEELLRKEFYKKFVCGNFTDKPVYEVLQELFDIENTYAFVTKALCCASESYPGWLNAAPTYSQAVHYFSESVVGSSKTNYSTYRRQFFDEDWRQNHLSEIKAIRKKLIDRLDTKIKEERSKNHDIDANSKN